MSVILMILLMGIPQLMSAGERDALRVLVLGAHPDDCDGGMGGTAALMAQMGCAVKFVSVTSGDAGHQSQGGGALACRRRAEAAEAGRRFGIAEYITLDNHDAELVPSLDVRHQIIRLIRELDADLVLTHRLNTYHPDHRYTAQVVQDAAYLVIVPNVCPDTPPSKKNPVFMYLQDGFQRPNPFRPDVSIIIDETIDKKMYATMAHESQMFEWGPWTGNHEAGVALVPKDAAAREKWFLENRRARPLSDEVRKSLAKWYGEEAAKSAKYAESFEVCEYGYQPSDEEIRDLFPMLKK